LNGEQLAGARDVVGGSEKASRSGLAAFALLDVDHHALASMSQTLSETTSAAGPRHTIRQPAAAAPAASPRSFALPSLPKIVLILIPLRARRSCPIAVRPIPILNE
jgi:hypothetical protein